MIFEYTHCCRQQIASCELSFGFTALSGVVTSHAGDSHELRSALKTLAATARKYG